MRTRGHIRCIPSSCPALGRTWKWPSSCRLWWVCPVSCLRVRPGLCHLPGGGLCVWQGVEPPHPGPDSCVCICVCWQLDKIEGVFERPSDEVIRELSRALRQALGVSLFGIDIIINNQTGQHAVIDINAFPGERWGRAPPSPVCRLTALGGWWGPESQADQLHPSLSGAQGRSSPRSASAPPASGFTGRVVGLQLNTCSFPCLSWPGATSSGLSGPNLS